MRSLAIILVLFTLASGCDTFDSSSSGPSAAVSVSLEISGANSPGKSGGLDELVLPGSNGTLTITDVRFILDEFELESAGTVCSQEDAGDDEPGEAGSFDDIDSDDASNNDQHGDNHDGCAEIEAGPLFVQVPLDNQSVELFAADIPLGLYSELEFEIDNLEQDDDESESDKYDLAQIIRSEFPDWPAEASVVVIGSFAPADASTPRDFVVYIDADIKLKLKSDPPLELTAENVDKALTLVLDPLAWFGMVGVSVIPDLSALDYASTGEILHFDLSVRHGFSIRSDHD